MFEIFVLTETWLEASDWRKSRREPISNSRRARGDECERVRGGGNDDE